MHGGGAIVGRDGRRHRRRDRRRPGHRARRRPAPTTASPRRAWKTASGRGTSDDARSTPLRFATVGSVDDGKSTLIGRLLFDSKSIFEDQLEHVAAVSRRRGDDYVDLALLTDGLRAEREQGITIDVAYRYFSTPAARLHHRRLPGPRAVHAQHDHRRVDCRPGDRPRRRPQRRRRADPPPQPARLAARRARTSSSASTRWTSSATARNASTRSASEFTEFASTLDLNDVTFIPISALHGDNVVDRSATMGWYEGPTLLHHLETVYVASDHNLIDVRFPVQYVIRPHQRRAPRLPRLRRAGRRRPLRPGDEVVVLPSGMTSRIARIDTFDGPVEEARPPQAVIVTLDRRHRRLPRRHDLPAAQPAHAIQDVDAMVAWMDSTAPLRAAADLHAQAHDPHGAGDGHRPALPPRRQDDAP